MKGTTESTILSQVAAYYASKLAAHGPTPLGVDWNGTFSHEQRHRQFLRLLDRNPHASIIDLGCGFGDFLRFLRASGHRGPFIGYDVAPSMIKKARELYGEGEDRRWRIGLQAEFSTSKGTLPMKSGAATFIRQ
jgi:SAM-dependent methyltransferase